MNGMGPSEDEVMGTSPTPCTRGIGTQPHGHVSSHGMTLAGAPPPPLREQH